MSSTEITPAALVGLAHPEGVGHGIDCSYVPAAAFSANRDDDLQVIFGALQIAEAAERHQTRPNELLDEHSLRQALAYMRLRNLLADHGGSDEIQLAAAFEHLATDALCRAVA